eukprot:TRINITY_DN83815_c0_g1_i1.p1 TRINITY_DN83815_c0_g1~~TRINITY_DN83815_c0_g1_i1.p1  ORF type:complete len:265 (+),score=63.68 TRINITY_DN83815_c0_g1_i1:69-863(+)
MALGLQRSSRRTSSTCRNVGLLAAAVACYLCALDRTSSTLFTGVSSQHYGLRNVAVQTPVTRYAKPGPPMPPQPVGVTYPKSTSGGVKKVVEMFLDLCCPYSKKMFLTITKEVAAKATDVDFVFMPVPQPWHPQSTLMHEAALAVREIAGPQKFWEYCDAVFAKQESFFDDAVVDKTRGQIYADLAAIAGSIGVDSAEVLAKLAYKQPTGNSGTLQTQALKWAVKLHRTRGVHVTPTVFLNGLEAGVISSGWSASEWMDYLKDE